MKRSVFVLFILALICVSSLGAFDGARKGFVLGGGVGFAANAGWEFDDKLFDFIPVKASENNGGGALNFFLGYAWDEKNMIAYEANVAGYSSDLFDQNITQTFTGPEWCHYYGSTGKSIYTTVGLGLYIFDGENFDAFEPGPGLMLGGGYEFARHFQVGFNLAFGSISEAGVDVKLHHVSILLNAVAF
ncbi:MAG: hypothetical protein R3F48_08195 [Candidatus Zixiibacteriota bacterium]